MWSVVQIKQCFYPTFVGASAELDSHHLLIATITQLMPVFVIPYGTHVDLCVVNYIAFNAFDIFVHVTGTHSYIHTILSWFVTSLGRLNFGGSWIETTFCESSFRCWKNQVRLLHGKQVRLSHGYCCFPRVAMILEFGLYDTRGWYPSVIITLSGWHVTSTWRNYILYIALFLQTWTASVDTFCYVGMHFLIWHCG